MCFPSLASIRFKQLLLLLLLLPTTDNENINNVSSTPSAETGFHLVLVERNNAGMTMTMTMIMIMIMIMTALLTTTNSKTTLLIDDGDDAIQFIS